MFNHPTKERKEKKGEMRKKEQTFIAKLLQGKGNKHTGKELCHP